MELGTVGVSVGPQDGPEFAEVLAELEEVGYDAIWLAGGPMRGLDQVGAALAATRRVPVGTGIIAIVRFGAEELVRAYAEVEARHPGRFVPGIGGAHVAQPMTALNTYLDRLDGDVPADRRVLSALGPRMLQLARDRSAGALPILATPDYVARARDILGPDKLLAVQTLIVPEKDPALARRHARGSLEFLGRLPAYQAHFRRMGFAEDDVAQLADRLVDGLVPWGDEDTIAARTAQLRQAGADHIVVSLITGSNELPRDLWRRYAPVLR